MSWPSGCESGQACNAALGAPDSGAQGSQFLSMHTQQHGGRKTRRFRMQGGAVAELASFESAFEPSLLPENLHTSAGVTSLDQANADLAQFRQTGGVRRTRRMRGGVLEMGPAEHGGSLISADMEKLTFQNPQWYDENLVNPAFVGPTVAKVGGGKKSRKAHRKSYRKSRKVAKKARKQRKQKGGKKSRKSYRKSRKVSRRH